VQAGTGAAGHRSGRISRTYRAGTDFKTVVRDIAESNGLKIPASAADVQEFLGKLSTGITLNGPSSKEMHRILGAKGFSHSIQDDQLQLLKDGDVSKARAIVCSEATGMLGSPELGTPEAKGKPPVLTVRMWLEPELSPGGLLSVASRDIRGAFKILRVTHTGDNRGKPWYSDVEATPL